MNLRRTKPRLFSVDPVPRAATLAAFAERLGQPDLADVAVFGAGDVELRVFVDGEEAQRVTVGRLSGEGELHLAVPTG